MTATCIEVPEYSGRAVTMAAGETVKISDVQGTQIGDFFALGRADDTEYLSASVTRLVNRTIFPRPGQAFYSNRHRPIMTFEEDHSPGIHDMLFAPCSRELYESRGMHDHPNCRENYLAAAAEAGISHRVVPDPVNIFQNSLPQADGTLDVQPAASAAGDFVIFRAELDVTVILAACSSEFANGGASTPLLLEVLSSA